MPGRLVVIMLVALAGCGEPMVLRAPPPVPEMEPPPEGGAPLPALARPTGEARIELPMPTPPIPSAAPR